MSTLKLETIDRVEENQEEFIRMTNVYFHTKYDINMVELEQLEREVPSVIDETIGGFYKSQRTWLIWLLLGLLGIVVIPLVAVITGDKEIMRAFIIPVIVIMVATGGCCFHGKLLQYSGEKKKYFFRNLSHFKK